MNKIAIAFLATVSLASFGCKKKGGGEAMEAMKKYKADICACKDHDVDCGKKASDAFMKSQSEGAGKATDMSAKPDPEQDKMQTEIADCTKRVMTPDMGAAGAPPAGGAAGAPPAGGADTAAPAGGTPPAAGSDTAAAPPAPPAAGSADGSAAGSGK